MSDIEIAKFSWYKRLLGLKEFSEKNVFLDSNILIYSILETDKGNLKRDKSIQLLDKLQNDYEKKIIVSTQVLGEIFNVLSKKYQIKTKKITRSLEIIAQNTSVRSITEATIRKSWEIAAKSNYSYYDCLIIASAIENNCSILYSEDLQNEHIIKDKGSRLKIINPYS